MKGSLLFELCIGLVIMAILTCMAMPDLTRAMANTEGKQALSTLAALCNLARAAAVKRHIPVTLCPSADEIHCSGDWHNSVLVFWGDQPKGAANAAVLAYMPVLYDRGRITLHLFPAHGYLQFNPYGQLTAHNGTLQYCPANGDARTSHALFISSTGKIRWSQDQDQDGIDENAEGQPLNCLDGTALKDGK